MACRESKSAQDPSRWSRRAGLSSRRVQLHSNRSHQVSATELAILSVSVSVSVSVLVLVSVSVAVAVSISVAVSAIVAVCVS
eukprot:814005-Rhodomonas_salina.1